MVQYLSCTKLPCYGVTDLQLLCTMQTCAERGKRAMTVLDAPHNLSNLLQVSVTVTTIVFQTAPGNLFELQLMYEVMLLQVVLVSCRNPRFVVECTCIVPRCNMKERLLLPGLFIRVPFIHALVKISLLSYSYTVLRLYPESQLLLSGIMAPIFCLGRKGVVRIGTALSRRPAQFIGVVTSRVMNKADKEKQME